MEKEQVLHQIKILSSQGILSREEVLNAFEESSSHKEIPAKSAIQNRLSAVFYLLGAAIVVMGLTILIAQNWDRFNDFTKILVTFGSAIIAFIVGVLFVQEERLNFLAQGFFFISALVMPIGLNVTFYLAGFDVRQRGMQCFISGILFFMYLVSFLAFRKTVLLIFSILFGSWAYFGLCDFILVPSYTEWRIYSYRILVFGLTYIFLGYYFSQKSNRQKTLSNWLMGIGVFSFLGAALSLGGWSPNQNVFWELFFPILNLGIIYLSVYLKNKPFLFFGALYSMGYISKITAEYFSDSMGWAFSLVLMGFVIMGIGYFAFYINKKYIKNEAV